MVEGTSISDHISEFAYILNDLGKIDVKMEDEDPALCYCAHYPHAFRGMLIYSRDKISLEDVKSILQAKLHIDSKMTNNEKGSQGVGLIVEQGRSWDRNSKDTRTRSKSRHKNLTCNYCKKKGHIKTDCFNLKNKQKADT